MRKGLFLGVALTALALSWPASAELKFAPGEDARFTWSNFDDLKKVDLKGETLSIFGPWRGEDEALVRSVLEYFIDGDRGDDQLFLVRELRAADRHRHAGRQPAQYRDPPAAGPAPGPGLQGPPDAARRRCRDLRQGQLRRRPVLGRSRHLQGQGRHVEVFRIPLQGRPEVAGLVRAGEFRGGRLRSSQDLGRHDEAVRADRGRWRRAVVHRAGLRRRHRLAGDRLGRGHHAAHPAAGSL